MGDTAGHKSRELTCTAKNAQPVLAQIKYYIYLICGSGLMKTGMNNVVLPTLFKVVNIIVQHCYTELQANPGSLICPILLKTLNNVSSKTLFNPVFIGPEQVVRFLQCKHGV